MLYAIGWSIGWLLLWSTRPLPASAGPRPAVAVVVPARNEEESLPHLLGSLRDQLRTGDELVVVDDHSVDGTAAIARSFEARTVAAPALPPGWVGKPHACWIGAGATTAPILVFLDADVRLGPRLLDRLAANARPGAVTSVQPWHDAVTFGERVTLLANVAALMGCGAFTALGDRLPAQVAFGPVLAVERATYDAVGGHGHPAVRASLTEDIELAGQVGRSRLFTDRRDASFRMYPRGFGQALAGWSRTMAAGLAAGRWWVVLGVVAWVWSLAGGPFTGWLAYPLSAIQVGVVGRRAGRMSPVLAALYPLLVAVLALIVIRAAWLRACGTTSWKGRPVRAA